MLRVFLTLFNLQGTRSCQPHGQRAIYFSTFAFACQELFSSFFEVFSSNPLGFRPFQARSHLPARTHLVYHTLPGLSRTFFRNLSEVRPASARSLLSVSFFFLPSREALRYNTSFRPLCQHLFPLFFRVFSRAQICGAPPLSMHKICLSIPALSAF